MYFHWCVGTQAVLCNIVYIKQEYFSKPLKLKTKLFSEKTILVTENEENNIMLNLYLFSDCIFHPNFWEGLQNWQLHECVLALAVPYYMIHHRENSHIHSLFAKVLMFQQTTIFGHDILCGKSENAYFQDGKHLFVELWSKYYGLLRHYKDTIQ